MIDDGRHDPERDGRGRPVHVLVLNQHGDNRGDEAAFRAMFAGIEERSPRPVKFTVLHQFSGGSVHVEVPQEVRWISLVPPTLREALGIALFALGRAAGVRPRWLLGRWGRSVAGAYAAADVAVSAPGGPYLGDPYSGHELVHWFYIWLADRSGLALMLYAPSVGPFERPIRNVLRRRLFRRFRAITVREEVSLGHLDRLLEGRGPSRTLVSDSALQRPLRPLDRKEYFGPDRLDLAERFLVGVSAIRWTFPGHPDPEAAHVRYERVVLDALAHLHDRKRAHLLFVPQLYGAAHSDVPYLESLAGRLPPDVSWELVSPHADSDRQQRLFGMTDLYFASRYHPQIFATANGVPGVCIYYQHKALGYLRQLGLERFAFPIGDLDRNGLREALEEALDRRVELGIHIAERIPSLREAAARSSELAVEMFPDASVDGERA